MKMSSFFTSLAMALFRSDGNKPTSRRQVQGVKAEMSSFFTSLAMALFRSDGNKPTSRRQVQGVKAEMMKSRRLHRIAAEEGKKRRHRQHRQHLNTVMSAYEAKVLRSDRTPRHTTEGIPEWFFESQKLA